jgi:hypothetical protein
LKIIKLKEEVFPDSPVEVLVDLEASRPNPPTRANQVFVAKDSKKIFYSVVSGITFAWEELPLRADAVETAQLAISAGESRFKLTETDTDATRVKNAINTAKLSSSAVKVIYVPKDMWGYIADSDFDLNMFDPGILMLREGSIVGWYDPVAYGADITGNTNSRACIDICYAHALTTTVGIRMVAFTVPGTYLMTTDVDQRAVPLFEGTGTSRTGGGILTGTRPFRIPADAIPADKSFFNYAAALPAGNRTTAVVVVHTIYLRVLGTSTGASLTVELAGENEFDAYPLSKLHSLIVSQHHRVGTTGGDAGGDGFGVTIDATANTITFSALAIDEVHEFDLLMNFTA